MGWEKLKTQNTAPIQKEQRQPKTMMWQNIQENL